MFVRESCPKEPVAGGGKLTHRAVSKMTISPALTFVTEGVRPMLVNGSWKSPGSPAPVHRRLMKCSRRCSGVALGPGLGTSYAHLPSRIARISGTCLCDPGTTAWVMQRFCQTLQPALGK